MSALRIWKWTLRVTDQQRMWMPKGAKLLCVQTQRETPQIWALVDESADLEQRAFDTYGTGNPMPDGDPGQYIGTYQVNRNGVSFVFHVFEAQS
jgi:hypothetical protein